MNLFGYVCEWGEGGCVWETGGRQERPWLGIDGMRAFSSSEWSSREGESTHLSRWKKSGNSVVGTTFSSLSWPHSEDGMAREESGVLLATKYNT